MVSVVAMMYRSRKVRRGAVYVTFERSKVLSGYKSCISSIHPIS